jgi:hypothetical protein
VGFTVKDITKRIHQLGWSTGETWCGHAARPWWVVHIWREAGDRFQFEAATQVEAWQLACSKAEALAPKLW